MTSFQLVRESTHRIGQNSYLEVSRKRLVEEGTDTEFLLITRGFYTTDGQKRWTRFVTLPDDAATKSWLVEALLST